MELLIEYWPFIMPLIILQFILATTALIHVLKHRQYRFGNKVMWIFIVLFIQIFGPIIYFTFGRGDE